MKKYLVFLAFLCLFVQAVAQEKNISLEEIMKGNEFVGYSPEQIYWSESGDRIYFNWNPGQEKTPSLYYVQVQNGKIIGKPQKAESGLNTRGFFLNGTYNEKKNSLVYASKGDLFLYQNNQLIQLSNTLEQESNPVFSQDEKSVLFQRGDNLYSINLTNGSLKQWTDFRQGNDEKAKKAPPEELWLQKQQSQLFEVIRDRQAQKEAAQKKEALSNQKPKTMFLQGKRVDNIQLSPDQKYISFRLIKDPQAKDTKVADFVTESGYIEDIKARTKVGTPQNTFQTGIYDIEKDTITFLDYKNLEGIYEAPAYYKEYNRPAQLKEARELTPLRAVWSSDGKNLLLTVRAQDNKDWWILKVNPAENTFDVLYRERDEAWVLNRRISGWVNGQLYYFTSEKTGYNHLYTVDINTKQVRQLTDGKFEITEAYLSPDKSKWFLRSNEAHPGEYHLYEMPLEGGKRIRITNQPGIYEIYPSPDAKYLALRYSYSNKPWELYFKENKAGSVETQITFSQTESFKKTNWIDPQIITFKARDNAEVYARLYRPQNPETKGKAVIFVHGAGYLQNVHKGWSSYFREYLFHNFLVQQGYTVLDMDYRGSEGYGRDWRTGIYRHMGGNDLNDHIDGAKMLVEKYDISPDRIGIYGGSYGGFITLMALFTSPDTFKAGAGLRSVTDWAHYNHGYTANILNTPVLDSIAFQKSSPINFAQGLKNRLLICHGMVDDNVQFQDVVRLAQRLIELKKENWEFAVYPVESHGFVEASSWYDEYRRIFKLFEESLK